MTTSKQPGPRNVPPPAGGAKQTNYSRFIPREELSSFAAWNPASLSGADEPSIGVQRPQPPAPPAPPMPSPEALLAAHVNQARQTGYQDGYRDGLVALEGFKQSFAMQMSQQLGALTQSYGTQLDDLQQDLARALAVTATQLAQQMVRSELTARPELVAKVATEAIDTLLLSARHITLRVNPDDHALVLQGAGDALAARGARVLVDTDILRGGCLVESDIGVIDATLETRWRRAAGSVGCDQAWGQNEVTPPEETMIEPVRSDDE
jgi:flagellar assembly protein FliH